MPYSTAGLNAGANGVVTAGTYISLHTSDPGSSGTGEVTGGSYARQQSTFGAASGGTRTGSQVAIPVPAATVTHWGLWSAVTSGTFLYGGAVTSETFANPGTFQFTPAITATN